MCTITSVHNEHRSALNICIFCAKYNSVMHFNIVFTNFSTYNIARYKAWG